MGPDWIFDFFDKGIADLTGYDLEEFLDRKIHWLDLIHEEDRSPLLDTIRVAMESDRYCLAEFRIRKKTGQTCWVRMSALFFVTNADNCSTSRGSSVTSRHRKV